MQSAGKFRMRKLYKTACFELRRLPSVPINPKENLRNPQHCVTKILQLKIIDAENESKQEKNIYATAKYLRT